MCVVKVPAPVGCSHGDAKLVDGPTSYEGRVEVCVDGAWYTVCGEGFDRDGGQVICSQLLNDQQVLCK